MTNLDDKLSVFKHSQTEGEAAVRVVAAKAARAPVGGLGPRPTRLRNIAPRPLENVYIPALFFANETYAEIKLDRFINSLKAWQNMQGLIFIGEERLPKVLKPNR